MGNMLLIHPTVGISPHKPERHCLDMGRRFQSQWHA